MAENPRDSSGGIFILSEPENALTERYNNDSYSLEQIDQNQLTTNSEELRQLRRDVQEFTLMNPQSSLMYRNAQHPPPLPIDDSASSYMASTGGIPVSAAEDMQHRAMIQRELALQHDRLLLHSSDEAWGWIIVFGALVCMIVVDGCCFSYGLHLAWINQYFQLNSWGLSCLPGSLITGLYLITSPFANPLANYFTYRRVGMFGCLLATVSILVSSFCKNFVFFTLSFGVLAGIGFGLMYLPAIAIVAHWFNRLRAVAIGLALCGSGIGTCILALILPLCISSFHGNGSLIIIAAICLQSMVGIAFFRPFELHNRLKQMKLDYKQWCKDNEEYLLEQRRLKKERKFEKKNRREQKRREKMAKKKPIIIKRGSIFTRIMEEKHRQRNVSTGSLDGMLITQNNQLVTASQVNVGALFPVAGNNILPGSGQSSLSGVIAGAPTNFVLPQKAMDRVVEATLAVMKRTPSSSNHMRSRTSTMSNMGGFVSSLSTSKKSSSNSVNDMMLGQGDFQNQVPMELVKKYLDKKRNSYRDDGQLLDQSNANFKLGSTLLMNQTGNQAEDSSSKPPDSLSQNTASFKHKASLSSMDAQIPHIDIGRIVRDQLMKELDRPNCRRDLYYTGSVHQLVNLAQQNISLVGGPNNNNNNIVMSSNHNSYSNFQYKLNRHLNDIGTSRFSCPVIDVKLPGVSNPAVPVIGDGGDDLAAGYFYQEASISNRPTDTPSEEQGQFQGTGSNSATNGANDTTWWRELLEFQFFCSFQFQLLLFSSFFMMLGFFVPFFFLPVMIQLELSRATGLLPAQHHWWISAVICALGIANVIGRLIATLYIEKGWVFSYKKANGVNLTILFLFLCSLVLFIMPYSIKLHIATVLLLAFIYGFSIAIIVSIRSILVVEIFGVENLTKSFTFLLLFQGIACIFGPICAGYLCDISMGFMDVDGSFLFSGATYFISALTIIILVRFHKKNDSNIRMIDINNKLMDEKNRNQSDNEFMTSGNARAANMQHQMMQFNQQQDDVCEESSDNIYDKNQTTQTTNIMQINESDSSTV